MNKKRKILLSIYSLMLVITGILFVPAYSVWGSDKNIDTIQYVPLWKLMNNKKSINGFTPIYELCISRIIVTIVVITLITISLYFVLDDKKS